MRFSISTGCGYPEAIKYADLPDDLQTITGAQFRALLEGRAAGKTIVAGPDGAPTLADPAPPTADQRLEAMRASRNQRLAASDWTQAADAPLSPDQRTAWATYRQALRDLPSSGATIWPVPPS